jgi:hypothetical protein
VVASAGRVVDGHTGRIDKTKSIATLSKCNQDSAHTGRDSLQHPKETSNTPEEKEMKTTLALLAIMLMGCDGPSNPTPVPGAYESKPKSRVKIEALSSVFDPVNVVSVTVDGVEHIVVHHSGGMAILPR